MAEEQTGSGGVEESQSSTEQAEAQAREQTGQGQIQVRIDERNMETTYANAFRTNTTAEEVMVDFGLNLLTRAPQQQQEGGEQQPGEIQFKVNERVVMNYYTAKRLALTLGQVIRRHEQQFGELKLNAADRRQGQQGQGQQGQ